MKYKQFLIYFMLSLCMHARAFDPGLSGYLLKGNNWQSEYKVMSIFVMPGQSITVEMEKNGKKLSFSMTLDNPSTHLSSKEAKIEWKAPLTPGLYSASFKPTPPDPSTPSTDTIALHIFVMYPISQVSNGKLKGYTIGSYPKTPLKGLAIYLPPKGFVEVTEKNQNIYLSPHYQLKQFLCKQSEPFPKYVVLQTRLLRKLEFLTQVVNQRGISTEGFVIMSGYRTPYYNTAIKNKKYSRHQWGGAADIFIDENPKDGVMDDLDHDGKISIEDARVLWNIVESFYHRADYKPMIGGLGLYAANTQHGPFIHVDVRGFRARW